MEVSLINADEADYDFAKDVHHRSYKDMVIRQYGAWDEMIQDDFFRRAWDSMPHFIIWVKDQPCGFCCIEETNKIIQIMELAILPNRQREGIGSELLGKLINKGKQTAVPVKLNVMKSNRDAKRLYERVGFVVFDENETHFLMEKGN